MCIYSIFGYGKGKTESAVGITIRAIANDEKILFAQFLKNGESSEIKFLENDELHVKILTTGTNNIVLPQNKTLEDIDACAELYRQVFNEIATKEYNILVLDEILVAVDIGIISYAMLDLLLRECKDCEVDVYMTGRIRNANTRQHIIDISDCCTNAYCEKHMYNKHCEYCRNDFPFHYTYCPDCGSELQESKPCKIGRDY